MMLSFVLGSLLIVVILGGTAIAALIYASGQPFVTPEQKAFLITRIKEMGWYLFFFAGILSSIAFLIGFFVSYHMVGPLNRTELWLELVLQGHSPSPLKLRDKDEMYELAQLFNKVKQRFDKDQEGGV